MTISYEKIFKIKFIFYLFLNMITLINYNKYDKLIKYNKWIILAISNPPNPSIFHLLNILNNWKIVVVSNNKEIDKEWKSLDKIIYLSLEKQNNLGYKILKYLNFDSPSARKNIGYLYAIQHGAKEIFEIDENITIPDINDLNINYQNSYICFGKRNDSSMINPYSYFKKNNLNFWPRGFRLSDIGKYANNKFYFLHPKSLLLKPLIYQGIINGFPDFDSIFLKTKILNQLQKINFINNYPLVYLPGNYIPINSKNTKYLYDIFPFLFLPTTVNERISDIWRGYIMQYFAWRYNGCVIYYISKNYIEERNLLNQSQFYRDKNLFFNIDKFLDILNINSKIDFNNATDLLFKIINDLISNELLGKNEIKIYKAFFEDLFNVGYSFSSKIYNKISYKFKNYINSYSEFNYYFPFESISILNNRSNNLIKIINHYLLLPKLI